MPDNVPGTEHSQDEALSALFDESIPTSLVNVGPLTAIRHLRTQILKHPELISLLGDEQMLLQALYERHKFNPSITDHRVRMLFWLEYEQALVENRRMIPARIYNLFANERVFHMR